MKIKSIATRILTVLIVILMLCTTFPVSISAKGSIFGSGYTTGNVKITTEKGSMVTTIPAQRSVVVLKKKAVKIKGKRIKKIRYYVKYKNNKGYVEDKSSKYLIVQPNSQKQKYKSMFLITSVRTKFYKDAGCTSIAKTIDKKNAGIKCSIYSGNGVQYKGKYYFYKLIDKNGKIENIVDKKFKAKKQMHIYGSSNSYVKKGTIFWVFKETKLDSYCEDKPILIWRKTNGMWVPTRVRWNSKAIKRLKVS